VPSNVNRCDGLWAEAEGTPGFIITKVQLVLRDCHGVEVYRTKFGKSKIKDYKKAYYECMREAFVEIKLMNIHQQEPGVNDNIVTSVEVKTIESNNAVVENKAPSKIDTYKVPSSKYTNYNNNGNTYLLRKTSNGYNFYQEFENLDNDLQLLGKIKKNTTNLVYVDTNNMVSSVHFDALENLIIEKDGEIVVYKIED
jgi:hypothetical protein